MSEYEQKVIAAAENEGWTVYTNGWPDLLLTRGSDIAMIEIKSHYDKVRPHQKAVLEILTKAGIAVTVNHEIKEQNKKWQEWTRELIFSLPEYKRPWIAAPPDYDFEGLGVS